MNEAYHIPVMLKDSVDGLAIQPSGTYADLTFGGGGHSTEILNRLGPEGKLVVFDQDEEAFMNLPDDHRLYPVHHNFKYLKNFLEYMELLPLDGLLADLGVSSHQFDEAERGFSFRADAPLDMRMSEGLSRTAAEVLNTMAVGDLQQMFSRYGEIQNARTLSQKLHAFRQHKSFEMISDLLEALDGVMPAHQQSKYKARVFQALRIEVNQEMAALEEMLRVLPECMATGGRISIISYHSLEDRMVKNLIQHGNPEGERQADVFGHVKLPFKAVERKPLLPSEEEVERNPRSRSAKLRIAERL